MAYPPSKQCNVEITAGRQVRERLFRRPFFNGLSGFYIFNQRQLCGGDAKGCSGVVGLDFSHDDLSKLFGGDRGIGQGEWGGGACNGDGLNAGVGYECAGVCGEGGNGGGDAGEDRGVGE